MQQHAMKSRYNVACYKIPTYRPTNTFKQFALLPISHFHKLKFSIPTLSQNAPSPVKTAPILTKVRTGWLLRHGSSPSQFHGAQLLFPPSSATPAPCSKVTTKTLHCNQDTARWLDPGIFLVIFPPTVSFSFAFSLSSKAD